MQGDLKNNFSLSETLEMYVSKGLLCVMLLKEMLLSSFYLESLGIFIPECPFKVLSGMVLPKRFLRAKVWET